MNFGAHVFFGVWKKHKNWSIWRNKHIFVTHCFSAHLSCEKMLKKWDSNIFEAVVEIRILR